MMHFASLMKIAIKDSSVADAVSGAGADAAGGGGIVVGS